ncbi:diaminopimelate decarboxylase [Anoxybacterium hadale]|uniref:Diaminopimelate decarboxylase n=1 Tax=Anoxybacterium hadale TaxID=3408580 RepID=A0ACD1ABR1_9FIRM|nr:diaminopimelate decarboxylase [Clostridiales bacterium]
MEKSSNYYFSGMDTVALAQKYGTPLYVVSEDIIREKIGVIRKSLLDKYPGTKAFYASKAFLTQRMCKILMDETIGVDAVSSGEIYTALKAGVNPEHIVFHGNNKTPDDLTYAISNHVGKIVVDSISEIELLSDLVSGLDRKVELLIRTNPSIEAETHRHMNTAQKDSKFGVSLSQLQNAIKIIMASDHLHYSGLHFHIGSQLFKVEFYLEAIRKIVAQMKVIKDQLQIDTEVLNIGGGYGVDYIEKDKTVDFAVFMDTIVSELNHLLQENELKLAELYVEPGRWIIANAGITLYSVGTIKEIPGIRTYVSVDGGMPDNIRPSLYGAKYNAVAVNKADQPKRELVTIAGKCCETGDVLIYDICLPKLERGDYLAVLDTGAYNYSMSNHYNMTPKPALVFIKNGTDQLSIRRQTFEDLLSCEIINEEV